MKSTKCKFLKNIIIHKNKDLKIEALKCISIERINFFLKEGSGILPMNLILFEKGYESCDSCSFKK